MGGPAPHPAALRDPSQWRRVLVPAEHGGWSFLGEPVVLGLLVAPSVPGACLAAAAVAAFLCRQPLRLLAADRRRQRRYPRTAVAGTAVALLAAIAALAAGAGMALARGPVLLVVVPAGVLAAVALVFEFRRRAREVAAEVTAALALSATAAAIPLADGARLRLALGLWLVMAARAVPAILYVRARLRLDRSEPAGARAALAAHAVALALVLLLASRGIVPWLAAGAMVALAARAGFGLSAARPRWRPAQLGVSEVLFGVATVLLVVAGVWLDR